MAADGANWEVATGIFVYEQTVDALAAAVRQFLAWEGRFRPEVLRRNAERFSRERFLTFYIGLMLMDLLGPFYVRRSVLRR